MELLGVGKSTVSDWSKNGKLPVHYVGSVPFYNRDELLESLGERPKDQAIINWLQNQLNQMLETNQALKAVNQ